MLCRTLWTADPLFARVSPWTLLSVPVHAQSSRPVRRADCCVLPSLKRIILIAPVGRVPQLSRYLSKEALALTVPFYLSSISSTLLFKKNLLPFRQKKRNLPFLFKSSIFLNIFSFISSLSESEKQCSKLMKAHDIGSSGGNAKLPVKSHFLAFDACGALEASLPRHNLLPIPYSIPPTCPLQRIVRPLLHRHVLDHIGCLVFACA